MGFGSKVFGGAKDLLTGGGGGGGTPSTTVGTAVAGGMAQTFNITMEISGITDRSDKRRLAREIGDMIQEELSRGIQTGNRRTF